MRYEIDDNNAIRVFSEGQSVPFCFQPDWPDSTPWASKAEAENWAELLIESMTNLETTHVPGNSPNTHPAIRPEPVEEEVE